MRVVQDDNARVLQVQTGEVDIALDIPYAQVEALKAAPGVDGRWSTPSMAPRPFR